MRIFLVSFLLMPSYLWAKDLDFYTYGGFATTVDGFERLALM